MHDLTMTAAVFTPFMHFDLPQQNVMPIYRRGWHVAAGAGTCRSQGEVPQSSKM